MDLSINSDPTIKGYQIKIFSLDGKLAYSHNLSIRVQTKVVDLSFIQKGIYLLQIMDDTEMTTMKFIKK